MKKLLIAAILVLSSHVYSQSFTSMGKKEFRKKMTVCETEYKKTAASFKETLDYYRATIERDVIPARKLVSISMIDGIVNQIQGNKDSEYFLDKEMPVADLQKLLAEYKKEYRAMNPGASTLQFMTEKDANGNVSKVTPYIYSGLKFNGKILYTSLRKNATDLYKNLVGIRTVKNKNYTDGKSLSQFNSTLYTFNDKEGADLLLYLNPVLQDTCKNIAKLNTSSQYTNGIFDANQLKVTKLIDITLIYNPEYLAIQKTESTAKK